VVEPLLSEKFAAEGECLRTFDSCILPSDTPDDASQFAGIL
jgi:hypothetical protein|tara:strand:+ start:1363 stop:1485 length:123 start_codon:yes stop_codon:yes gene_type:complete